MDTCVCCGRAVPEGRMVCQECEIESFALHQLATSVEVLATKQETIEANVTEIKADVKSIKALPGIRWEAIVKGVITALIAGLIGFALAKLGLG